MNNFDDIFESTPQTDEFDKEAWAAKKKAERDEVYALTDATAEAVCADGGKFREYLDVQAAFRNYSATNALLILATKPDARKLGDKDFWRDQGVYIKRQEFGHPIKIVESNGEYTRDDGSIGVSYNIKRVYDISQTTARTRAPQAVSHDARALLNALIYKRPAPVQSVDELPNGMNAVYDREQNTVFVRRGLSAIDLFCGLSKALAQAELARTGEEYTEENAGFKAQCVSYMNHTYLRGDMYYADLGRGIGSEQEGYRPVVIIQNNVGNKHSPTVIIASITSKTGVKAKLPTHYYIDAEDGLELPSIVLLEQLRTVDKRRLGNFIGHLSEKHICGINHALAVSIGLIESVPKKLILCLCSTCADNFYGTGAYYLRRIDPVQVAKDTCTYCNQRKGYDYELVPKKR